ncbi:class I SAM-dependent methyltransferase [Pelagibacteraceae bacterium]|nr:class I SAM-dependent methyltransferase [Pelagibacteraceae bacterium]
MGQNLEITKRLEAYIENLSKTLHPIQKEIISYNESLGDIKRMQISISQCQLLELMIKVSNSKKILEIGTFTGLSALSMSLALPEDGKLIALDKNAETNKVAKEFFKKAKQENKIKTIIKPALETLTDIKKENKFFDLVFIDADKDNYKEYYDRSLDLVKKGGLIIIDNVLWHGEVADEKNNEKFTNIIRDFNEHVKSDKNTDQIIIPIGDGLTVCRKI